VLEDLYDRLPIMVMNDEGHHCWRPAATQEDLATVDKEDSGLDLSCQRDGLGLALVKIVPQSGGELPVPDGSAP
jgi:hypothetical protein